VPYREFALRRAYVRLVPDGTGTRLVGEVRVRRWVLAVWGTAQVVTLLLLAGTLLFEPGSSLPPLAGALVVQLFSRLGCLDVDRLLGLLADVAA
jgi:hypothetical protein